MPILQQNQPAVQQTQQPGTPEQKQPQGTGFVNLSKFLQANQGGAGAKLGQSVLGGVQGTAQSLQGSVGQAQNQFNQGLGQFQQNLQGMNQASSNLLNQIQGGNLSTSGNATPLSTDQVNAYQNLQNAQYTGPQGLSNADQLQQQAANVQGLAKLAGTTQGRQQLLQQFAGNANPNYTGQKQALDELVLSQSQGGQQALRQAGQQANQIGQTTAQNIQNASLAAQGAQQQLGTTQQQQSQQEQNIASGINTAVGTAQQQAQQQQTTRQAAEDQYNAILNTGDTNKALNYAVQNGLMNSDQANTIRTLSGFQDQTGSNNITTPLGELQSLYNIGNLDTSRAGVTTAEQKAQLNALAQITGNTPEFQQLTGPSTAGTSLNTANVAGLGSRMLGNVQQALQTTQGAIGSEKDAINALANGSLPGILKAQIQQYQTATGPSYQDKQNVAALASQLNTNDPNQIMNVYNKLVNMPGISGGLAQNQGFQQLQQNLAEQNTYQQAQAQEQAKIAALQGLLSQYAGS